MFFASTAPIANASTSFLTQEQKDSPLTFNIEYVQTIACSDLVGKIDQVTVSMTRTGLFSANWRAELLAIGVPNRTFVSTNTNILGPRYEPTDLTFHFDPINVESGLCVNSVSRVMLRILPDMTDQNMTALINGGIDNPYMNGYYSYNNTNTTDIYFAIRMQNNVNTKPVLDSLDDITIPEGSSLSFNLNATDVENDALVYSATNLPSGAYINSETGEFFWVPSYDQSGTYEVMFTVTDSGEPQLSDSKTVFITVDNVNRAPEMMSIDDKIVKEGELLTFTLNAVDSDGDELTYSATNLPSGAVFDTDTRVFTWTPTYSQAGNYPDIEFTVTDSGTPIALDLELVTITVGDVNRAPQIINPGTFTVLENEEVSFTVSGVDPDSDSVTITALKLPSGAFFDGSRFIWIPTHAQEGVYVVTFVATDDGVPSASTLTDVIVTVGNNPTPVEQAQDLIENVLILIVPPNVENSYLANLLKVEQFIEEGKVTAALNQLNAFIKKVTQDRQQGILTQDEESMLIAAAQRLISDLSS